MLFKTLRYMKIVVRLRSTKRRAIAKQSLWNIIESYCKFIKAMHRHDHAGSVFCNEFDSLDFKVMIPCFRFLFFFLASWKEEKKSTQKESQFIQFYTCAGEPCKEILLKKTLPDTTCSKYLSQPEKSIDLKGSFVFAAGNWRVKLYIETSWSFGFRSTYTT